jgi:hypothetical protein
MFCSAMVHLFLITRRRLPRFLFGTAVETKTSTKGGRVLSCPGLLLVFSSLALFPGEVMEGDDDALPLAGVGKHVYRAGWDVGFPAVGEVDDSTDVMVAGEIGPADPVADLDTSQACGHLVFLRSEYAALFEFLDRVNTMDIGVTATMRWWRRSAGWPVEGGRGRLRSHSTTASIKRGMKVCRPSWLPEIVSRSALMVAGMSLAKSRRPFLAAAPGPAGPSPATGPA